MKSLSPIAFSIVRGSDSLEEYVSQPTRELTARDLVHGEVKGAVALTKRKISQGHPIALAFSRLSSVQDFTPQVAKDVKLVLEHTVMRANEPNQAGALKVQRKPA